MKSIRSAKYIYVIAALFFFTTSFLYKTINVSLSDSKKSVNNFSQVLVKKEKELLGYVNELADEASVLSYDSLFIKNTAKYSSLFKKEGFALLVYENDSLKFWTDNSVPVENYLQHIFLNKSVVKLNNGWFELIHKKVGNKAVLGLLLLKKEYPYHNQYLEDAFQNDFKVPSESRIVAGNYKDENAIFNYKSEYLFSLEIAGFKNSASSIFFFMLWNLAGIIMLLLALREVFTSIAIKRNPNLTFIALCTFIFLVRYLSIHFRLPRVLYDLDLFSPEYFASSNYNASLADLLINSLLLLYLSYGFYKHFNLSPIVLFFDKLKKGVGALVLIIVLLFCWSGICSELISLVRDSKISLQVDNIFSLDILSYIAFFIIGLFLFSFYFITERTIKEIVLLQYNMGLFLSVLIISSFITLLAFYAIEHFLLLHILLALPIFLIIYYWHRNPTKKNVFVLVVIVVLIFSFSINYILIAEQDSKEELNNKSLAENLADDRDPVAEVLYSDIEKKFLTDTMLTFYLSRPIIDQKAIVSRLTEKYFNGYWQKFSINYFIYDSICRPMVQSVESSKDLHDYFEQIATTTGLPTSQKSLFYFNQYIHGKTGLVGKSKLRYFNNGVQEPTVLFVQIETKFVNDEAEAGFPVLLLDKEVLKEVVIQNYSYARYKNHGLMNHVGDYEYDFKCDLFDTVGTAYSVIFDDKHKHFVYKPGTENDEIIVITRPEKTVLNKLTIFAYLFTFFSVMLLFYWSIRNAVKGVFFYELNFKNKIQILFVTIVFISLLLFGSATLFLLNQQYTKKNAENLDDKLNSVLLDLEQKIGDEKSLNFSSDHYLTYLLTRIATVFSNDINLYDTKGDLLASSQNKLFEEGLLSRKMNPQAYNELIHENQSEYVNYEQIGKLNFMSAYIPFFNNEHILLAYINLPTFSKQQELEKEISTLLVALINIYVFLFVLSVFLALFISSRITEPLKLLQNKLSKIKLGTTNELIEWKNKDEIGNLIIEYNRMIVELSNSAEMHAKSERESAWREMAKQVAHEIKNPLTPMKLSIQYLERSWKDNAPDWESKLEKVTKTMVEQIDTLTTIANEFSNFAKMPTANNEKLTLSSIIDIATALYQNEIRIEINYNGCEQIQVYADKEQLLRVFNNIIKNGLQAIKEGDEGMITIRLSRNELMVQVAISDNGVGIEEVQKDRIFFPNFTTKSSGTGLGLAMVKNIVEMSNGRIWFETEIGKGTTFFIELPIVINR